MSTSHITLVRDATKQTHDIGCFFGLGDVTWEFAWRYITAHIARIFCHVIMSKKDRELLDLDEVCARCTSVEMMEFSELSIDQRLLKNSSS